MSGPGRGTARMVALAGLICCGFSPIASLSAQDPEPPPTRFDRFPHPPLVFDPPEPEVHTVEGVPVLYLHDPSLPLVTLFARFRGGYAGMGRGMYAAGLALPSLLRYGGTETLDADSLDTLLEYFALQTSFGGAGGAISASVNTLTEHLDTAIALWGAMLREPRFDPEELDVWRGRELESVRRRVDDPTRLAFSEFNRLLYGDHPVGWEMTPEDLLPGALTPGMLREMHGKVVCPDRATLGVSGDVTWDRIEPLIAAMLADWPACTSDPGRPPPPEIRRLRGVFVIPRDLDQSVIVMAHPTDVHLGEGDAYFSAQIGNSILGSGGFSSRLMARLRTEQGFAYSAGSLWTTPRRYEGLLGAITRTRPGATVDAIRLMLDILDESTRDAPTEQEVGTAVDQIVNGFVFNFENPAEIVSRRMFYLAEELPSDWLELYLQGIQEVTPESILRVFQEQLHPEEMTILVVGDPERIGWDALEALGPVTVLEVDAGRR